MKKGDCVHFTGMMRGTCEAGVNYEFVKDKTDGPLRLPCLPNELRNGAWRKCVTTCDKFRARTQEEEDELMAGFAKAFEDAQADKCSQCGADLIVQESERSTVKSCPTHGLVIRECRRIGEPYP